LENEINLTCIKCLLDSARIREVFRGKTEDKFI